MSERTKWAGGRDWLVGDLDAHELVACAVCGQQPRPGEVVFRPEGGEWSHKACHGVSEVDSLVHRLFELQQQADLDGDPGDLWIVFQDDSALVEVYQPRLPGEQQAKTYAYGSSAVDCLNRLVRDVEQQLAGHRQDDGREQQ